MNNTSKKSFAYKQMCLNKHIRFLSQTRGTMTGGRPFKFRIVSSSFCDDNRKLYLKYKILDSPDMENNSIQEEYDIDGLEFKILCHNLFNPYAGQMLSLYEKSFFNISGTAHIYFIDFVPYVDTVSIQVDDSEEGEDEL